MRKGLRPTWLLLCALPVCLCLLLMTAMVPGARAEVKDIGLMSEEEIKATIPEQFLKDARFERPALSPDEEFSPTIPPSMRCDACYAVAFQIERQLNWTSQLGKRNLKELEIIETMDDVCRSAGRVAALLERRKRDLISPEDVHYLEAKSIWDAYGIKVVDGINRISGEGLATASATGLTMTKGAIKHREHKGRPWSMRFEKFCQELVGELGEDELYKMYRESPWLMPSRPSSDQPPREAPADDRGGGDTVVDAVRKDVDEEEMTEAEIRKHLAEVQRYPESARSRVLAEYHLFKLSADDSFAARVCRAVTPKECLDLHRRRVWSVWDDEPLAPFMKPWKDVQQIPKLNTRRRPKKSEDPADLVISPSPDDMKALYGDKEEL